MDPVERIDAMRQDVQALNREVRESLDTITLADAMKLIRRSREIEGWLKGVRVVLQNSIEKGAV